MTEQVVTKREFKDLVAYVRFGLIREWYIDVATQLHAGSHTLPETE